MSAGLTSNLLISKLMLKVLLHLIACTAFVKALENMLPFKSLLKLRYHYKELPLTILDKKCKFKWQCGWVKLAWTPPPLKRKLSLITHSRPLLVPRIQDISHSPLVKNIFKSLLKSSQKTQRLLICFHSYQAPPSSLNLPKNLLPQTTLLLLFSLTINKSQWLSAPTQWPVQSVPIKQTSLPPSKSLTLQPNVPNHSLLQASECA